MILEGDESMFGIDLEKMTISGNGTWEIFRMQNCLAIFFFSKKKILFAEIKGLFAHIFKKNVLRICATLAIKMSAKKIPFAN